MMKNLILTLLLGTATMAAQTLTTLDTFTVDPTGNGGTLVPLNIIQDNDGNLYTTTPSLPSGELDLFRITRSGSISIAAVQPVTDCFAELKGSDGNLYGLSNIAQGLCEINPSGNTTALPSLIQAIYAIGISGDSAGGSIPIQAADGFFYGTISSKFISGNVTGFVWKMSSSGDFAIFSTFPTNQDQPFPYSTLLQGKDGNLYGTTTEGLFDGGAIFKVTTAGVMTFLHIFAFAGTDGSFPNSLVWASDGSLYGTTNAGGASRNGTFFKIDSSGTFSVLYNFQTVPESSLFGAPFVQASDGDFYGLQAMGGANGDGALFRLTPSGDFSVAYSFTQSNKNPTALINGSDGNLYGITDDAEPTSETGTLFKFAIGGLSSSAPSVAAGGIISAGGFGAFTDIAPGTFIEIYGTNLASDTRGWAATDFNGINAPTSLDGTSVSIGGLPAFVNFISPGQVNVLVPSSVPTGAQPLIMTTAAGTSSTYTVNVNAVAPGLLAPASFLVKGAQYLVAQFLDGTYAGPTGAIAGVTSRPAVPGDILVMYGIGFGPTTPYIPAGEIAEEAANLDMNFQISIGGTPATVLYAGLAPGFTGVYQFNVTVPDAPIGSIVPVTFTLGGVASTQALNIAVGQ